MAMISDSLFSKFPEIKTDRLVLREINRDDTDSIFRLFSDPEVARYYDLSPFESIEEAERLTDSFILRYTKRTGIRWAISMNRDRQLIGTCGFQKVNEAFARAEVGYDLMRSEWRRGIMREAISAIIDFGFKRVELNRIEALCMVNNFGSIELLKNLGFKEEGTLSQYVFWKGEYHDMKILSRLRRTGPVSK